MKRSDFMYELPERLIAQNPAAERTASRLMVVNRNRQTIEHGHFEDLKNYLVQGDCLVFNDTKVMPARLLGKKKTGQGNGVVVPERIISAATTANTVVTPVREVSSDDAIDKLGEELPAAGAVSVTAAADAVVMPRQEATATVEVLLLHKVRPTVWEAMVRPGKRLKAGAQITLGNGELNAEVLEVLGNGNRLVRFFCPDEDFKDILSRNGQIPLPPYITNCTVDRSRYQTVYANDTGSAAAPTAGLHFTKEYIAQIRAAGIDTAYLTLHVGPGTFQPVKAENIEDHRMHSEFYRIGGDAVARINQVKTAQQGDKASEYQGRVVAVGTTSVRTLESAADEHGLLQATEGWTDIFIYPGYRFRCVDMLLTNFHLPGSTLLMLVSAFADRDLVMEAYRQAVEQEYRFFSFGDAMLIL